MITYTTNPINNAALKNHLLALGSTPDKLAANLWVRSIKGERDREGNNPLDNYLKLIEPTWTNIWCGYSWASANGTGYDPEYCRFDYEYELGTNHPFREFMTNFIDRGLYSELAL